MTDTLTANNEDFRELEETPAVSPALQATDETLTAVENPHYELMIVGGGPAALTAAIYAGRAGLNTIVFVSEGKVGGELATTTDVENFPGFPEGIQGPDLMFNILDQAEKFGADIRHEDVEELDVLTRTATTYTGTYTADALILTTGSEYRKLGIPGEMELSGHGVSWCATCDAPFFKGQDVVVIGGGDSAMEEAIHLTHHASSVTIIHRSNTYKASTIMLDRARRNPNITFLENKITEAILGENGKVTGVVVRDVLDGTEGFLAAGGVFIAVGSEPRTHLFHHQVQLTPQGVVQLEGNTTATSVPGVFAAGDVADARYRQAITAAGSGAAAALDAGAYLQTLTDQPGAV